MFNVVNTLDSVTLFNWVPSYKDFKNPNKLLRPFAHATVTCGTEVNRLDQIDFSHVIIGRGLFFIMLLIGFEFFTMLFAVINYSVRVGLLELPNKL